MPAVALPHAPSPEALFAPPWASLPRPAPTSWRPRRSGGRKAPSLTLGGDEREALEELVRAGGTPQRLVRRCLVVLLAAQGQENRQIAPRVGLSENTVSKWRRRFHEDRLAGLHDAPRSGRPSPFRPEQKAWVLQKATQWPRESGLPIQGWSNVELAKLAVAAGITTSIHPSTVGKWLRECDLKPHRHKMWMDSQDPHFEERMRDVVDLYRRAPYLAKHGIPVFCVDEKTSIQALERSLRPPKPGHVARYGHRYKRHGTANLMGAFQVATGKVWGKFVEDRTAATFCSFIQELLASVPDAPQVHIVLDQLNTHYSAELCEKIAQVEGMELPWGTRKSWGDERRAFLMSQNKRVVFHFTPTNASWLDQIEMWFSVLGRKALNRASFGSVRELQEAIYAFMDHHNRFRARPYRWTYTGTPCRA